MMFPLHVEETDARTNVICLITGIKYKKNRAGWIFNSQNERKMRDEEAAKLIKMFINRAGPVANKWRFENIEAI